MHFFQSLKMAFASANSADSNEMLHHAPFHCLPKYPFRGLLKTHKLFLCVYAVEYGKIMDISS